MSALTHILAAALALAAALIHAAWRRWHQEPPKCECGLFYCPGGAECVGSVLGAGGQVPGAGAPDTCDPIPDTSDDMAVWKRVCEGVDKRKSGPVG